MTTGMTHFRTVLIAGLLAAGVFVPALLAATGEARACALCGTFRVVGVAEGDVLYMRAKPRASAAVVGVIPGDPMAAEHAIYKSGGCRRGWCVMTYGDQTGWVRMRYLEVIR